MVRAIRSPARCETSAASRSAAGFGGVGERDLEAGLQDGEWVPHLVDGVVDKLSSVGLVALETVQQAVHRLAQASDVVRAVVRPARDARGSPGPAVRAASVRALTCPVRLPATRQAATAHSGTSTSQPATSSRVGSNPAGSPDIGVQDHPEPWASRRSRDDQGVLGVRKGVRIGGAHLQVDDGERKCRDDEKQGGQQHRQPAARARSAAPRTVSRRARPGGSPRRRPSRSAARAPRPRPCAAGC